ncbi:UDP-Glycosyltransferase/glycogen phosphorylase [Trametes elegans]|nr:UDP-Glycosyltransferase/glycogen phosphorylase [Trametes elegans]
MSVMEPSKRILLLPMNMWGHARPICTFAARIVALRPVSIDFFIAADFIPRARAELARDVPPTDAHLLSRIRFIPLNQGTHPLDASIYEPAFLAAWAKLRAGESLEAVSADGAPATVSLADGVPLLGAVVDTLMVGGFRALQATRAALAPSARFQLHTWFAVATSMHWHWCAEDRVPLAEAIAARKGISFDEAATEVVTASGGEVLRAPCLPPVYDYEWHPQQLPIPPSTCGKVFIQMARVLRETDGIITFDAADYHPESTAAMRAWLAYTARKIVFAGPLIPGSLSDTVEPAAESTGSAVAAFLETQLKERGERSVIMIAFGSMFWPSDPAKLGTVLDVLMESDIPFILSTSSPFASIPESTHGRISAYNRALLADWIPQQTILQHPAVGWSFSHAGHNTVLESIHAGVPMILWPIDADQPQNALHLSENLCIAYELLSVRHGAGLGRIFRTGVVPDGSLASVRAEITDVLRRAFGDEGEEMRQRLEGVRAKLDRAWNEDGEARREVGEWLDGLEPATNPVSVESV